VNIASRCAGFIHKGFDGVLAAELPEQALLQEFQHAAADIAALYDARDFSKAMRLIMSLADKANAMIAEQQPWTLAKANPRDPQVQAICSAGLNLFRLLVIYLKPVLPEVAALTETFFKVAPLQWQDARSLLTGHRIAPFQALLTRVDPLKIEAMLVASQQSLGSVPESAPAPDSPLSREPLAPEIEFPDFAKVDMRVVRILHAEHVEGADKLLKLTLDLGTDASGQAVQRTVFSGIKSAYKPEDLIGQHTVMVANLKARKMKFGMSEGMILAAGDGKDIFLMAPHEGAVPGTRVT